MKKNNSKHSHELLNKRSKEFEDTYYFLYVDSYGKYGCAFRIEEEIDGCDYPIIIYANTNIEKIMEEWAKIN